MKSFKEYMINRDMPIPEPKSKGMSLRNQMDKLVPKPIETESFSKFNIRWLIRRDISDVLEIDNKLTQSELENYLREENVTGLVCEASDSSLENNKVIGFIIYKSIPRASIAESIEVLRMKYDLKYEDKFFSTLMPKLLGKLDGRLNKITMLDDENSHPSFYAKLKNYGFVGNKTDLGWEFTIEKARR